MLVMQTRSLEVLPPDRRWMIQLDAEEETLGEVLQRLREEREWTQYDVAARVDPERRDDVRAMKNLQTMLSRYELDTPKRHDPVLLEKLEHIYGLPANTLVIAANRTALQVRKRAKIREKSIAIPDEPAIVEGVEEYLKFDDAQMPAVTEILRVLRSGPHISEETIRETIDAYLAFHRQMEGPKD